MATNKPKATKSRKKPTNTTSDTQLEHERTVEPTQKELKPTSGRNEANLPSEHHNYLDLLPDDIRNNPDSIWYSQAFPSHGRTHDFTPAQLLHALHTYSCTIKPDSTPLTLEEAFKQAGIRQNSALLLIQKYPDIRQAYDVARAAKAKLYNQAANAQYAGDISDLPQAYDIAKDGSQRLSSAYVTYRRDKANHMHRQAVIHDKRTFGEIKQVESKSVNVTLHGKLDAKSRIADIDTLLMDD